MGGLFGGDSSSSSRTSQTTTTTDNRRVIAEGGVSNEGGTVNILDGGAIKNAFDYATAVNAGGVDMTRTALSKALDYASSSQGQALDSLTTTAELVKDSYADAKGRGALTDQILIGSIAMAGLVAVMALKK